VGFIFVLHANWEYKIITSGSLGFGSLQLLEQHLNLLGKEEWEIIHFQTRPENPLLSMAWPAGR